MRLSLGRPIRPVRPAKKLASHQCRAERSCDLRACHAHDNTQNIAANSREHTQIRRHGTIDILQWGITIVLAFHFRSAGRLIHLKLLPNYALLYYCIRSVVRLPLLTATASLPFAFPEFLRNAARMCLDCAECHYSTFLHGD